jgi:hypothetical protein
VLDARALSKCTFLTELRCPRLAQLIYDDSMGVFGGGLVPFVLATDLASRYTVRLSLRQLPSHKRDGSGVEPDGFVSPR